MARNPRRTRQDWTTPEEFHWQHVEVELLMDIRDELIRLNQLLHCPNFTAIPHKLDTISKNTKKKPRKAPTSKVK